MKGVFFIIRDKGVDTEYNEVDDIPAKFDKVIRFASRNVKVNSKNLSRNVKV